MTLSERARKEMVVLGLVALALATASADAAPAMTSTQTWWEKITFTIAGDGPPQACRYETSLTAQPEPCDDDEGPATVHQAASGPAASYTKITIERRFTPAGIPEPIAVQTGDTLLGGQVMQLAIDRSGSVRSCRVVGTSGDMRPPYGCDDVRAERFQASAGSSAEQLRKAFMTVMVYGHDEDLA